MPETRSMGSFSDEKIGELLEKKLEKFRVSLTDTLIKELKKELRDEFSTIVKKQEEKIIQLESSVAMLQEHVSALKQQHKKNESNVDENEQYGRRLCLRVDGVKSISGETSADVLTNLRKKWENNVNVQAKWKSEGVSLPDSVIDRAHRIGKKYKNDAGDTCQGIIIRFSTFRHRTLLYYTRKELKGVTVKLDLTKRRYNLLKDARSLVQNVDGVKFAFADINCRLKVRMEDDRESLADIKSTLKLEDNL